MGGGGGGNWLACPLPPPPTTRTPAVPLVVFLIDRRGARRAGWADIWDRVAQCEKLRCLWSDTIWDTVHLRYKSDSMNVGKHAWKNLRWSLVVRDTPLFMVYQGGYHNTDIIWDTVSDIIWDTVTDIIWDTVTDIIWDTVHLRSGVTQCWKERFWKNGRRGGAGERGGGVKVGRWDGGGGRIIFPALAHIRPPWSSRWKMSLLRSMMRVRILPSEYCTHALVI